MGYFGFWLFLTAIVLAPWVFSWLKERDRQKSIRSFIGPDGKIDPGVLEFFRQLQTKELAQSQRSWIKISNIDHAIAWLIIALSFLGGFSIMAVGVGIFGSGPNHSKSLLVASFVACFVVWFLGVLIGYKVYKRGSKDGSPPQD